MPTNYRASSASYDKESKIFIEPVRIVDDIVDFSSEIRIQTNTVTTSAAQLTLPADCEVMLLRHVDATDVVWVGADNTITAGGSNAWPLRPEDPPLRIRVSEDTFIYAITANGNVDLHILGMVKR